MTPMYEIYSWDLFRKELYNSLGNYTTQRVRFHVQSKLQPDVHRVIRNNIKHIIMADVYQTVVKERK